MKKKQKQVNFCKHKNLVTKVLPHLDYLQCVEKNFIVEKMHRINTFSAGKV